MKHIMKLTIFALVTLMLLGAKPVMAQETAAVTVLSPTQEVKLTKSQLYHGTITLRNRLDVSTSVSVGVSDFIVTDTEGTPLFVPANTLSNRFAAASWIELPKKTIAISAKNEVAVPYTVHVPSNATAGGHYVSLIFKNIPSSTNGGSGATINVQVAALVSLVVAGPVHEKASITSFALPSFQESGPVHITTTIHNEGDIHIKPSGAIHVTNLFGKEIVNLPLEEKNIFPDAAKNYQFAFTDRMLFGPYVVRLAATYGSTNLPLIAQATIWIIPWRLLVLFALALIALILGLLLVKKKIHHDEEPPRSSVNQQIPH